MFLAPWFAIAGLIAAAGPIVIHLLNRRRYRVVDWAAMDFLREAIIRSRRILRLRDLLLLALRTLCIVCFGLAMARPFLDRAGAADPNQPTHAVVLMDNSLSMGYKELDGTLLDKAKQQAQKQIEDLPRGSRISVLPICGAPGGFAYTAYYTKEDALDALAAIQPVDRSAMADETIDLAAEACDRVPTMANKRILLYTDRQIADWPLRSLADHLEKLPAPIEVNEVAPVEVDNAWIADFRLRDGAADLETSSVFLATIAYEGPAPRRGVEVSLTVDDVTVATQTVDLQPGQQREVEFPPYRFDVSTEPGKASYATAEVAMPQDDLPGDDQRFLVVPVVSTLPVVFVDQFGAEEDPRFNRYGETYHLRRLLAPVLSSAEQNRQLIEVRHKQIHELSRSLLEDARMVVIAGVMGPDSELTVQLLREYVEQGGNVVIAAGGHFDPAAWSQLAWQDGRGILPAPLNPVAVGQTPDQATGQLDVFQLDYNSLRDHHYFLVEGSSQQELEDLYRLPYFFKAVEADVSDSVRDAMVANTIEQLEGRHAALARIDSRLTELANKEAQQKLTAADRHERARLQLERADLVPSWLLWADATKSDDTQRDVEDLAAESKFSVLARYTNGLPFMVQRKIGRGKVLLVTTGVYKGWNTLTISKTAFLYDRILRDMLQETLRDQNFSSQRPIVLPVAASQRTAKIKLSDGSDRQQLLTVDPIGSARYGVTIDNLAGRGHYYLTATRTKDSPQEGLDATLWRVPVAINGPAEESQLLSAEAVEAREARGQEGAQVAFGAVAGIKQASLTGADLWQWLMLAVLACLLVELLILAWPAMRGERTA